VSNKFLFTIPTGNKAIDLPIEIKWDFYGRDDSIEIYEEDVLTDVIGIAKDYEISRFSHLSYDPNQKTEIKYDFHFYDSSVPVTASTTSTDWVNSYLFPNAVPSGFSPTQVYFYEKPFTKSFFKLDFYDTKDSQSQTNYFTIIIPVQQGATENVSISPLTPNVDIRKPSYTLDFVGDKEGFFIYWLKDITYLNIDTFYMSAKFFDGRFGVFVKMMNEPQGILPDKFIFDGGRYFYNKVVLDYTTKTYQVFDYLNSRIGAGSPIKWYEYINP
jgi:hypothetical protein